jgi:hypothetical protein
LIIDNSAIYNYFEPILASPVPLCKLTIMQRLLFVFIFGSALSAAAQANTNVPEKTNTGTYNGVLNNTNANSNTIEITTGSKNTELQAIPDTFRVDKPLPGIELNHKKTFEPRREKATGVQRTVTESKEQTVPAEEESEKSEMYMEDLEESVDTPASPIMSMQKQFETNQLNSCRQYTRRSASEYEQMNMDNSVAYYKRVIPDAFETHFYTYLAGHYNTDLYPELQAAAELRPGDPEVIKQLAAYHIITNNAEEAVPLIRELIDTGVVSAGQLLYANDLLLSGDSSGMIVTHGFEDMFAAYYVQNASFVRSDVRLLSLDFMQSATYRAGWENEQIVLPETEIIDTAYLAQLCQLNADQHIQLSMTLPRNYFSAMKASLYPVGLTFRYSETPTDNFEQNFQLWSKGMNLQLIQQPMRDNGGNGDNWSTNYLPMLVTLRRQLLLLGRKKEVEKLDQQILAIGARTNNTDKVKKYTK